MAILPTQTDYSDRDFDAIRIRLQNLIKGVFPDWTEFQSANFGNILLEMYAFVGDVLSFYQDNQARESRILTVTQRKNMIALVKLLAYTPSSARAATVEETFTLDEVPTADVIIPEGTVVRTPEVTDAIAFQLLGDVTIPAGSNPPTITATVENSSSSSDVQSSTGLPNQQLELDAVPYIDDTAIIVAGDGVYTQADNFLNSTSVDKHFVIVVNQSDRATVRFGNGINGSIPQGSISISYKTGGGSSGNVEVGTITTIEGAFTDIVAGPVNISVTNAASASGGANRETIEQTRQLAPESLRVLNRTVSREDYEINARRLPEITRALMTTSNEEAGIPENEGILYVIPTGGGVASSTLLNTVLEQVTVAYPNTLTFRLDVQNTLYLTVNVSATVFLTQSTTEATTRSAINAALVSFFQLSDADGSDNENVDYGFNSKDQDGNPSGEIAWSDIFNVVRDSAGVRKISDDATGLLLNGESSDLPILTREFPQLGTVTLINGATGLPF